MIDEKFAGYSSRESKIRGLLENAMRGDDEGRNELESLGTLEAASQNYNADKIVERLEALADALPDHEIADRQATKKAADFVTQNFRSALEKARRRDLQSITDAEEASTEAVIIADGSRPTLLLQDGLPPLDHPLIGNWRDEFTGLSEHIVSAASAICRVEPLHGSAGNYFGTGFLIDSDQGLVLTNQHVLEALLRRASTLVERVGRNYRIYDGVFVDFAAEADIAERKRFQVVEARPTPIEGEDFDRLDVAVLTIEPMPDSPAMPSSIQIERNIERSDGSMISFCTIGYPGRPEFVIGEQDGVDFSWVHSDLFGGRYGLKRLAPGEVHRAIGTIEKDPKRWVFGHDGTTLGGASGSPVIAWLDGNRAMGIHFAGATGRSNFAHSLVAAQPHIPSLLSPTS
jgi:hypothetical protein